MKVNSIKSLMALAAVALATASCENGDWEFPDYDHTAVYFASQSPIRTITLGEDVYDTSLDNEHKCQIMATMGGVYENTKDRIIDIKVDNSLCDGKKFKDNGQPIVAMPASHYTLSSDKIIIPSGKVIGGVTVQLTDAYFNDPMSPQLNYVIPVVMTHVTGADSILVGKAKEGVASPSRTNPDHWDVLPQDYVLYAVKYISKYDCNYLRRGVDEYSGAKTGTVTRQEEYVEKDEVINGFSTLGINIVEWARPTKDAEGNNVDCRLKLTFDASGKCTVTSNSEGVVASGTGEYKDKGEKNSWGGKDRDALYLDYTVEYRGVKCHTKDILVVRDRGVKAEWFTVE